jgi:hypothetical protein
VGKKQYPLDNQDVFESHVRWHRELFSMRTSHIFLIDSDSAGHRLAVDGNGTGTFPTLGAAEAQASHIARRFLPAATLRFELDFKWTLSDLEIRAATLEVPQQEHMENSYVDR